MSHPRIVARALALAFLAGPWLRKDLLARAQHVLGGKPKWLPRLVRLVQRLFPEAPVGRDEQLTHLLARSKPLREASAAPSTLHVRHWLYPEPRMAPVGLKDVAHEHGAVVGRAQMLAEAQELVLIVAKSDRALSTGRGGRR